MSSPLPPQTVPGAVALAVPSLATSRAFYEGGLGMVVLAQAEKRLALGAPDRPLVHLLEQPLTRRMRKTAGLYHMAIRLPSRLELAGLLVHMAEAGLRLQGVADHGVSHALYLADPDGNGIELYCDLPAEQWPRQPDGSLKMITDPLDLDALLAELKSNGHPWEGLPASTVMGHIHLQVGDVAACEHFYCDILGFSLSQRMGSSACFVSVGGYHHHLAFNNWAGAVGPALPDTPGLRWFELLLPTPASLQETLARLQAAAAPIEQRPDGWLTRDPAGNGVLLTNPA